MFTTSLSIRTKRHCTTQQRTLLIQRTDSPRLHRIIHSFGEGLGWIFLATSVDTKIGTTVYVVARKRLHILQFKTTPTLYIPQAIFRNDGCMKDLPTRDNMGEICQIAVGFGSIQ